MIINDILKEKNMSMYRLSELSSVPYATVSDICSGKRDIAKCETGTVYKLAKILDISVDDLLTACIGKRSSFENFKSTICHRLKELGDTEFVISILTSGDIRSFFNARWYPESFYLLAILDYISKENNIPLCSDYDDIRKRKLSEPIFPLGILAMSIASGNEQAKEQALKDAIPEFLKYNIIEAEVRDVV